jgi:uncharacterized membrane protein
MADVSAPRVARVESVDVVRGIIMVLMALDHTRDYFGGLAVSPTNIASTTVPLFFTRWVTHVCAPVFFLLAGTGAFLALRRQSPAAVSRFLWTRGVWLIVVEFTLFKWFGIQFNFDYQLTVVTVLWALGWSMVVLAALVRLPTWVAGTVGVAMIAMHNLLDGVTIPSLGALWSVLHVPGVIFNSGGRMVFGSYPLIPWVGVAAAGFALGTVYQWDAGRRRRFLWRTGLALTALFVVLRLVNGYGDPAPWSVQPDPAFTVLSFLNTTKYPPSLLFLLMTLGPSMLLLAAVDRSTPRLLQWVRTIGQVPMFYFLVHFALIHLLAVLVCLARYGTARWMFESPDLAHFPITEPPGWPLPLWAVHLIWISVVGMLYPVCRWYAGVKRRRSDWWLRYF